MKDGFDGIGKAIFEYYGLEYMTFEEELNQPQYSKQTRQNKMKIINASKFTRDLLESLENRIRRAPELDDKAHADLIQRVADKVNDIYKDVIETYNIGYNN
jgi:ribosome-binding protein aMBF1 (putative translation factor)